MLVTGVRQDLIWLVLLLKVVLKAHLIIEKKPIPYKSYSLCEKIRIVQYTCKNSEYAAAYSTM